MRRRGGLLILPGLMPELPSRQKEIRPLSREASYRSVESDSNLSEERNRVESAFARSRRKLL